jgi:DNA-binding NtrC family response regulator
MPHENSQESRVDALVVDDEPEIRELLVEHFRVRGFGTAAAADGRAAIAAIERSPSQYTLVFTDLQLPGASGLEVLQAARAANPSCYVVIITGYATLDSAVQAVRLGAYDYLTKPFSLGQIDIVINRIRDRLALESENRQLARRISERESGAALSIADRLASIDARLEAIERRLDGR